MLLNFNYYGLLVGIATVVAVWWWEKKIDQQKVKLNHPNLDLYLILLLALCGGRLWHFFTDWQLYIGDWWSIFAVWRGGLSILGALVGLMIAFFLISRFEKVSYLLLLDAAALALPFAQAIGRWGNYFNKELFGVPSNLPWAILINQQKVHPIFLYESLAMLCLGVWLNFKIRTKKVGSGCYFFIYLFFYLTLRFLLDFLRVQKTMFNSLLGINQVIILLVLIILSVVWLYRITYGKKH